MSTRDQVLEKIDAFRARTGLSDRQLSIDAIGDHNWMGRLRAGKGVSLTSIEKVEAFIDAWVPPKAPETPEAAA